MKRLASLLLAVFCLAVLLPSETRAEEVSCNCEQHSCKPCEIETDTTFYTAKCGPKNSKVKSCKKPTCEPVQEQNKCLADLKLQSMDSAARAAAKASATPAQDQSAAIKVDPVGTVTNVALPAKVVRRSGYEEGASFNLEVYEGDVIETGKNGKVRVIFKDQNILNVAPESRVTVETQEHDLQAGRRKTLLNLMYGKVRTKVNKANKYDGAQNTFQVKTKSAVAGVRGTDFVTTFYPSDKQWITEIKTFEGRVEFGGEGESEKVAVEKGQAASFIIDNPPVGDISRAQLRSYINKGILSEVRKMKQEEEDALDKATDFKDLQNAEAGLRAPASGRQTDSVLDPVCTEPAADFKSCSFACEGNPKGESRCNTELKGVSCVRRICNANGKWAEPTTLPKKSWSACDPSGIAVRKNCGDY